MDFEQENFSCLPSIRSPGSPASLHNQVLIFKHLSGPICTNNRKLS